MKRAPYPHRFHFGFTLVELLVAMGLLSFLMVMLASVTECATRAWRDGQRRAETLQNGRTALEIMARELTPAVVDTRMQFILGPGTILTKGGASKQAPHLAPDSPVLLWMAPLGDAGDLRCVGYYLYRNEAKKFYRLKRIYVAPKLPGGALSPYFPRMVNAANPRDITLRTSPIDAAWFTSRWEKETYDEEDAHNDSAAVSTAADGVIAFWVQAIDQLDRPIPLLSSSRIHPRSELFFNSASYFQMATTAPFENGESIQYLAQSENVMKANRVPAALDLTLITLDSRTLKKGVKVPTQTNVLDAQNALDVTASVKEFEKRLGDNGIRVARTFSTRVKLVNGS